MLQPEHSAATLLALVLLMDCVKGPLPGFCNELPLTQGAVGQSGCRSAAEASDANLVTIMEGHLEGISHGSWEGAWLPKEATCALACHVTACALRPGVEVKKALTVVQRGLDFTQAGLNAEALDHQVGCQASVIECQNCWMHPRPR